MLIRICEYVVDVQYIFQYVVQSYGIDQSPSIIILTTFLLQLVRNDTLCKRNIDISFSSVTHPEHCCI